MKPVGTTAEVCRCSFLAYDDWVLELGGVLSGVLTVAYSSDKSLGIKMEGTGGLEVWGSQLGSVGSEWDLAIPPHTRSCPPIPVQKVWREVGCRGGIPLTRTPDPRKCA